MENNTVWIVDHIGEIGVLPTEMSWFISINICLNCQMEKPDFRTVISCCEQEEHSTA